VSFDPMDLMAGLLFGGVGFVAFAYGKKMGKFQTMALGGALMGYSYMTPSGLMQWVVGAALTAAVWWTWEAT
jgi:hypothetical protein